MTLPSYRWRVAHLAALWAFGVSQPVFSMLLGNPEFLVVRDSTRGEVLLFALVLSFGPPLAAVALELLASLVSNMLARALHVVAVWCFAFLGVAQLTRLLEPEAGASLLLPMAPAAVVALAYIKSTVFRSFLSVAVALPVIGSLVFVVTVPLAVDDRAGADVAVRHDIPVVLIVLDEFPTSSLLRADGSIDERRYPAFGRLARHATWYPRATTVHEHSTQAVPAILTGRLPRAGQLPTLSDHPDNLFTLLGETYGVRARELITRLCPVRYCPERRDRRPLLDRSRGLFYDVGVGYLYRVLPASLRGDLPPIGDRWGGFVDEADGDARDRLLGALDTTDVDEAVAHKDERPRVEFGRFVQSISASPRGRTLLFLHLLLPHSPWRYLPSGREYGNTALGGGTRDGWNRWADSSRLVEHGLQRHLLQVGYTDRLVGELLDRLEQTGLYDRALLVVAADHGVSFRPGGLRRLVDRQNVADIASVPLFVKYPSQRRGDIDRRNARTIDILPTIADVLGMRMPWPVDGRSLRSTTGAEVAVSVATREGGTIFAQPDDIAAGVLRTARRNGSLFGEGADSFHALRDPMNVLGKKTATLSVVAVRRDAVELEGESLLADVDTRSAFMPAHIVGRVDADALDSPTDLAVAVNGRVAAVTRTFELDGNQRFAVLVPEAALRDGKNDVDIYSFRTQQPLRLIRLGGTGANPRYRLDPNGSILRDDGRRISVDPGRLEGRIDSWVDDGATVRIGGWAADIRGHALADRVLLFSGAQLVFEGRTDLLRWELEETGGYRDLERSGWIAELPSRDVVKAEVRAFAIRGSIASELEWTVR